MLITIISQLVTSDFIPKILFVVKCVIAIMKQPVYENTVHFVKRTYKTNSHAKC